MPNTIWEFSGFSFSHSRGLQSNGTFIPMQTKHRDLLELLLRADGNLVSKHTIAAALWADRVPSDSSIGRAVSGLRRVLGEHVDIIRTHYGEGIQLDCPVKVIRSNIAVEKDFLERLLRTAWEIAEARTQQGFALAVASMQEIIQPFPDAAAAWALLADAQIARVFQGTIAPNEAAAAILVCSEKALQREPRYGHALVASGLALGLLQGDPAEGLKRLESGLNAANWIGYYYRTWLHLAGRNIDAAYADLEYALSFVPLNRSMLEMKAFILLYQGKLEEAESFARGMQKRRDDSDGFWVVRSIVASEKGDYTSSFRHAEHAAQLMDGSRQTATYLAYACAKVGHTDRARAILSQITPGPNRPTPALLAAPYYALGEVELAQRILDTAHAEYCPYSAVTWCDPRTNGLKHPSNQRPA